MELSTDIHCLYTAEVSVTDDSEYTISVPEREIEQGAVDVGERHRIAILPANDTDDYHDRTSDSARSNSQEPSPPVSEGDTREVEIESLGDQGDGIAKVERGFVVIVPDTDVGERVTVEIADIGPNVAFAEVVERHHDV